MTANEVAEGLDLSPTGAKMAASGMSAENLFDALVKAGEFADAVRVAARLMTKPQAVWWGCLCAWHAERAVPTKTGPAALRAVVTWLREPTDENRRAAGLAAKAKATTAAAMAANAAFFSGGSLSVPGQKEVPPDPLMTAKFVANAVLAASRSGPANGTRDRQQTYLRLAVEVYQGRNTPEPEKARLG